MTHHRESNLINLTNINISSLKKGLIFIFAELRLYLRLHTSIGQGHARVHAPAAGAGPRVGARTEDDGPTVHVRAGRAIVAEWHGGTPIEHVGQPVAR